MKALTVISSLLILFLLTSCNKEKNTNELFGTTWEMDYISGPRIAFDALFPNKKPQLTFNKDTMKAEGNNGCNGYSADFKLEGDDISFGEPGPTTMMFCGQGEKFFLNTIKKVNKYSIDAEGKLNLMIDDVSMMRFKKTE